MSSAGTRKRRTELAPVNSEDSAQNTPVVKRVRGNHGCSTRSGVHRSPNENTITEDYSMLSADSEPEDTVEEECDIAGRLVSIELEDFMCHKHLFVKFDEDRNCTYIGGSNGSGKSALFAAINLGLGGKGRSNDRGGSAAAYIREGTNRARVTIVLTNEGIGKHPKYWDQIVVRRIINQKSGSTYELKSRCTEPEKEETVSKKKGDLDEICRRFNIDLENPVVWMSQDRSRQFLQELQPKKLFNMFMEASKLGNCYQQCAESRAELHDIQIKLEDFKTVLKDLNVDYHNCKKRLLATIKIREKNEELQQIECDMEWVPLKEDKELIVLCEKEILEYEKKINDLNDKKNAIDESLEELQSELNTTVVSEDFMTRKQELEETVQSKKAERQRFFDERADLKTKIGRVVNLRTSTERQLALLSEQLRNMRGIDYEEQKDKEQRLKGELERVMDEEERCRDLQAVAQENCINMRRDCDQAEEELKRVKMLLRNTKDQVETIERDKRRMEDIRRDRESRFGRDVPRIKQIIAQNAHMFDRPPIGPVGAFVSVADRRWTDVVEYVLKRQMGTFLVGSGQDRKTFYDLLDRNRIEYKPTVVCQRFHDRRLNIARFEPDESFRTVLRAITVSDDNVYNNLVEDCGAAGVLLLDSDDEARRLMSQSPPRNASKAITPNFGEAFPVSAGRPYRFYSNTPYRARFLVEDDGESGSRRDFEAESREAKAKYTNISQELGEANRIFTELAQRLKSAENENQKIGSSIERCAERREQIVPELQKMSLEVDVEMLGNLEQEIAEKKLNMERIKKEYEDLREELINKEQHMDRVRLEVSELEEDIRGHIRQEKELKRQRAETRNQINEKKRKATACEQRISEYEAKSSAKEQEALNYRASITAKEEKLVQLCAERNVPPLDVAKVPPRDELEDAKRRLQEELRKYEEALGGPPMTDELLKEKKEKVHTLKNQVEAYESLVDRLRQLFLNRYKQLQTLVAHLTYKLQLSFVRQLHLRNYGGTLDVDFKNRSLSIHVQTHKHYTDPAPSQKKSQDLRGLSGGERSYATASFVIALWECIECPFRLLDEFDVFMDMINRRIVMESLVHVATERYSSYQFFFFTPQGIQDIQDKQKVQIFRMPQVRR
ncbi:hypothetical protein QR680_017360 [Steinernema hermaphroditum]|uniref:RecF/RecN/SMC N-terminal domain-containing protein n=1 Tax=Steinernema hermaphroditum TaxID=289476 RepID=A0AA39HGF7_9BILA|nr:hypothetical protein QR680_017360 [Steinernema hermaphroditum]